MNSGTSGQHLGLIAAGVGPGQEVIVPSFTFAATANSVALTGAKPVFVDIDPATFNLDPAAVAAAVTEDTVGIMPVHLYGQPADMTRLGEIAAENDLQIFEDAAQAHGATWQGRPVGTFGTFAMFSLYPTKNMTSGEGGMVACATDEVARMVRLLRNQGMERRYENEVVGFNARMTDLHAAIGRVQLTKLAGWTQAAPGERGVPRREPARRRRPAGRAAARRTCTTSTRSASPRTATASPPRSSRSTASAAASTTRSRTTGCRRSASTLDLPETERAAREALSLPVHPSLTQDELERIVEAVNAIAGAGA